MLIDKQEKIFKQWFDEYKKLIFKVVKTYADAPQNQDDLFQEILLQLWSSIPSFQGDAKESTWIYRVALNTALVWKRTERRKRKRFRTEFLDIHEISQVKGDCDELSQNQHVLDQVYDSIRQLAKSESSILLLYLDGLSYDEMADVLGISKSNVGVRLNRAKKKLAQLLKGLIDDF
ncbi:MAG: RNA polymerase sigma factor [Planctomycetota bacterium]|jgi:RNA polymerase sigma-70 factor (ECF subfamily)